MFRNIAVILINVYSLYNIQKRPPSQNKRVGVLRMTFRARKVFGTFEKRAPGIKWELWRLEETNLTFVLLSSSAYVVHSSAKQVISRRWLDEDGCEMYKNEKCTCKSCKTNIFSSLNVQIFDVVAVALVAFPRTVLSPPCPKFLIIERPARYSLVFFGWRYSGVRINGVTFRFFFGAKFRNSYL